MIRSMTGFGSGELERDGQRLAAEIRSVNHRFCEVSVRAPRVVSAFEDQIRKLVQDRITRGKISVAITWSGAGESGEVLKVNEPVADRYMALLDELRKRYALKSDVDLRTLSNLPDIFTWEHTALSDDETWAIVEHVEEEVLFPDVDLHQRLTLEKGYVVSEFVVARSSTLANKTLAELQLRDNGVVVLSIQRGSVTLPNPAGSMRLMPGDQLVCYGKSNSLKDIMPPARKRKKKRPPLGGDGKSPG